MDDTPIVALMMPILVSVALRTNSPPAKSLPPRNALVPLRVAPVPGPGCTPGVRRLRIRTRAAWRYWRQICVNEYDSAMIFPLVTRHPGAPFIVIVVVSLSLAAGGVFLSEQLHLAACPLCIIQRMLYLLLALLAGLAIPVAHRPLARRLSVLGLAAIAATGAFVAGYQVWIQRFSPLTSCSGRPSWWENLVEFAGQQLPLLFRANGLCSDPAWKFLNLSIAEWSLLAFGALLLTAMRGFQRR